VVVAVRVEVQPNLLRWAVDRVGWADDVVNHKFPKFSAWIDGDTRPTLKQLQAFASATHAPLGTFFLDSPPVENIPIPDFRTFRNAGVRAPSPDLLDTIYICQSRQEWFRAYAILHGYLPLTFVGSVNASDPVAPAADKIRRAIRFNMDERSQYQTWEVALRQLIDRIEDTGVLVMINGVVGANTHRKLDPSEFRGFALADRLAPLIFVNGSDTKAAQIFTLVHELAHIWLGESALSDAQMASRSSNEHELWCNRVAAEVLVPIASLVEEIADKDATPEELDRLARLYKVSTLVVLKRLFDADYFGWDDYRSRYESELTRVLAILDQRQTVGGGGNYYYTQPIRLSRQFARAVIADTFEGGTQYRDAYRLLGTAKPETFENLATELGVA
jgi:Zn-dependent peptidase ImmA (M78 family)